MLNGVRGFTLVLFGHTLRTTSLCSLHIRSSSPFVFRDALHDNHRDFLDPYFGENWGDGGNSVSHGRVVDSI